MKNRFSSVRFPISEQYDLKGSIIDRKVGSARIDPHIALKDVDLQERNRRLLLGPERKSLLLEQIEKDSQFLEEHNICDYSFLVGFHFLKSAPSESIPSEDSKNLKKDISVFQSDHGGMISSDGSALYFIGIIDHFTCFDNRKLVEVTVKSFLYNKEFISAMAPQSYRARFQKFIASIVD